MRTGSRSPSSRITSCLVFWICWIIQYDFYKPNNTFQKSWNTNTDYITALACCYSKCNFLQFFCKRQSSTIDLTGPDIRCHCYSQSNPQTTGIAPEADGHRLRSLWHRRRHRWQVQDLLVYFRSKHSQILTPQPLLSDSSTWIIS